MGLKADSWIRDKALQDGMISPFSEDQVGKGVVSYGLSSYGYDIRVSNEFKIFTNLNSTVVDPKHFDDANVVDFTGDICIVPPNSFALASRIDSTCALPGIAASKTSKHVYAILICIII